jgi:ATP-dependent DNA helicase RecG
MPNIDVLFSSVKTLKNIAEVKASFLSSINIKTVLDLLFHMPVGINEIKVINQPTTAHLRHKVILKAVVEAFGPKPLKRLYKNSPYKIHCKANDIDIKLIYFSFYPQYIVQKLRVGSTIYVCGKLEYYFDNYLLPHPQFLASAPASNVLDLTYPLTKGLLDVQLKNYIKDALKLLPRLPEWQDLQLLKDKGWHSFNESLFKVHNPTHLDDSNIHSIYRERLAFDEFLAYQIAIKLMKEKREEQLGAQLQFTGALQRQILAKIGYSLTNGQALALEDIASDQRSTKKMARLIQGDVGSGKTLVALCAMANVLEDKNLQCCLMAPTDILANQHLAWISKSLEGLDLKVELLTGAVKGKKREKVLADLASGNIHILIGTHAVFQENVKFKDLRLIIIDEQHRFGVEQRLNLLEKGNCADLLIMSATPIPRTLSLAIYGDLDVTRIMDKPRGRLEIITSMIGFAKKPDVVLSLKDKIANGEKIYWVCPAIGDDTLDENNDFLETSDVESRYKELSSHYGENVAFVHGKMTALEKDKIIENFANSKIKILVSTTVIEVGVDVPDATIIIIEKAEKFGLSQLHQLRGRVGRGSKQSYCILLYSKNISEISYKRLTALRSSNDGFFLAEEDLKLRGGGNIVGNKQSGMPDFKLADFNEHYNLLLLANSKASKMLESQIQNNEAILLLMKIFNFKIKGYI